MQGRYLLGVTAAEETLAFLRRAGDEGGVPSAEELALRTARAQGLRLQRPASVTAAGAEPVPERWRPHLERVAARPLFQRLYSARPWQFAAVPLGSLLTVQPHLHFAYAQARLRAAGGEAEALELCLPAEPEPLELWGGVSEGDSPSASFYTFDPNVQITAARLQLQPQLSITFTISKTALFLHAVRLGGRLYLKNGSHRAVALALRGAEYAPCVLADSDDPDDLPALLPRRALLGPAPPRLLEFLDPDFYVAHPWRDRVKFIRLVPEEFFSPVPETARP